MAETPTTISPFNAALGAVKTRLMSRPQPTAPEASAEVGIRIARLQDQHASYSAEIQEVDGLIMELQKLRAHRNAQLVETAGTLNTLLASKAQLDQV